MNDSNHKNEKVVGILSSIIFGVSVGAFLGLIAGFLIAFVQGSVSNSALIPLTLLIIGSVIGGLLGFREEKKRYELFILSQEWELLKEKQAVNGKSKQLITNIAQSFVNTDVDLTTDEIEEVHKAVVKQLSMRIENGYDLAFIRFLPEDTLDLKILEISLVEGTNGKETRVLPRIALVERQYA